MARVFFPFFMYFVFLARFLSFCRLGTGLSDEEHDALVTKLRPHFRYLLFVSSVALFLACCLNTLPQSMLTYVLLFILEGTSYSSFLKALYSLLIFGYF